MPRRKSHALKALEQPWSVQDDLNAQHAYVERNSSFDFNLLVADAFLKGMRSVGYGTTANAIDELVDNALQAGASRIQIVFDGEKPTAGVKAPKSRGKDKQALDKRPTFISVIDDGHGMEPGMIRHAMIWGGTHRADDRRGFGRFGFGLPTASISQGRKYTVASRLGGEPFSAIALDIDDIGKLAESGAFVMPEPEKLQAPQAEITQILDTSFGGLEHGTYIYIERLDNLTWSTAQELENELVRHLGVYYRNVLSNVEILVNDINVEAIDPLFLMEGARYVDLDSDRAEAIRSFSIPVKDRNEEILGVIRVRASYLSPAFSKVAGQKDNPKGKTNARYPILREYNHGIVVCRNGRQVDIVKPRWRGSAITRDNYWGVEIDFPASLDELFSISTTKQRVTISTRIWELLEEHDIRRIIDETNARGNRERAERYERSKDDPNVARPSEKAAEAAADLAGHKPVPMSDERAQEAERGFEQDVDDVMRSTAASLDEARDVVRRRAAARPYELRRERANEGPFYRVSRSTGQKLIYLNTDHSFFTHLYARTEKYVQDALEVLLFALASAELNADGNLLKMYRNERQVWSRNLNDALDALAESDLPGFNDEDEERTA